MVLWKTTAVLIATGLTGTGIVAYTRASQAPSPAAVTSEFAASPAPIDESLQQQHHIQARFAAQRPFGCLFRTQR